MDTRQLELRQVFGFNERNGQLVVSRAGFECAPRGDLLGLGTMHTKLLVTMAQRRAYTE